MSLQLLQFHTRMSAAFPPLKCPTGPSTRVNDEPKGLQPDQGCLPPEENCQPGPPEVQYVPMSGTPSPSKSPTVKAKFVGNACCCRKPSAQAPVAPLL